MASFFLFSRRLTIPLILWIFLPSPVMANLLPFFAKDPYKAEIQGRMPAEIKEILEAVSDTFTLKERPPSTPEMLRRRAENDVAAMIKALRSEGFYEARIAIRSDLQATPPKIFFDVETGPAYVLNGIRIEALDPDFPAQNLPTAEELRLFSGTRARAPEILKARERLKDLLREKGFPSPEADIREAVVDHSQRTLSLHYTFRAEPQAFFGSVSIEGEKRVKPRYVENRIPWKKGELFQASRLNRLRSRLMQDGLFAIVDIRYPPEPDEDLSLPVHIHLVERSPRTLKAGVFYETDTGTGARLDWEHRNLRGMGERLSQSLTVAEKQKRMASEYRIPDFLDPRQSLTLSGWMGKEESQAYESEGGALGVKLFRQLTPLWSAAIGSHYRISDITQGDDRQTVGLLSFPLEITWEGRDSVLNPTQGLRLQWKAEPFSDTLDISTWFIRLVGGASAHVPLVGEDRLVLSARGHAGSILGESNLGVPADERFYAGGGGSIRGYAYQSIGPQEKGKVVGGRSIIETGLELRWRMQNNFGLVAFLDGGQVFTQSQLQLEDDFHWGAGLGLRYYTDFAPFRLDVGFPLNPRDEDDPFQIYISIGQAF